MLVKLNLNLMLILLQNIFTLFQLYDIYIDHMALKAINLREISDPTGSFFMLYKDIQMNMVKPFINQLPQRGLANGRGGQSQIS